MYAIEQRFLPEGKGLREPKRDQIDRRKNMAFKPEGMCWHYTGNFNPGADAEAHFRHWHTANEGTQYVLDDQKIIQVMPDTEAAWQVSYSDRTPYAEQKYPRGGNASLLGVEMCVHAGHNWDETYKRAVWLGAFKCVEYGWTPEDNFERHHDMTGKDCPRMWTDSWAKGGDAAWAKFKQDVTELIPEIEITELVVEELSKYFADVPKGEWYEEDVNKLYDRGIMRGSIQKNGDRILGVGQPVSTERLAVFLNRVIEHVLKEIKNK